ncbi:helix-turn-helix domain-containing protein [Zobellella sp. CGMCC 1.18722]|uniref:Helix-turn-helix domain-containing protein n=1 Tax=Zobellella iuensis TaxID=2803811 RepID=A0ABS1QRW6_9GAMM|nr:helix-turn-helix domain-containing protein [Zobellella iuensis]
MEQPVALSTQDAHINRLLENRALPVEKVAEMVGFYTATSFRQHFRQRYQVSPRAWRKTFGEVEG